MLFFHYVTRKLLRRFGNNALTIIVVGCVLAGGILGVEFLLGLRAAARDSIPADHVIVLGKGAATEAMPSHGAISSCATSPTTSRSLTHCTARASAASTSTSGASPTA